MRGSSSGSASSRRLGQLEMVPANGHSAPSPCWPTPSSCPLPSSNSSSSMVRSRTLLGGALALSSLGAVSAGFADRRVNYTASWEADPQASWHIHSLTLLQEDDAAPARCDRAREHDGEVLISALTSSSGLGKAGIEGLEGEWKERELGEGLEETLERAVSCARRRRQRALARRPGRTLTRRLAALVQWRRGGTCIPTFDPACSSAQLAALYPSSPSVPEGADVRRPSPSRLALRLRLDPGLTSEPPRLAGCALLPAGAPDLPVLRHPRPARRGRCELHVVVLFSAHLPSSEPDDRSCPSSTADHAGRGGHLLARRDHGRADSCAPVAHRPSPLPLALAVTPADPC